MVLKRARCTGGAEGIELKQPQDKMVNCLGVCLKEHRGLFCHPN